jgi:hypothetical protein
VAAKEANNCTPDQRFRLPLEGSKGVRLFLLRLADKQAQPGVEGDGIFLEEGSRPDRSPYRIMRHSGAPRRDYEAPNPVPDIAVASVGTVFPPGDARCLKNPVDRGSIHIQQWTHVDYPAINTVHGTQTSQASDAAAPGDSHEEILRNVVSVVA